MANSTQGISISGGINIGIGITIGYSQPPAPLNLVTDSGFQLITLSGDNLVTKPTNQ
jgi:hypothetical protein